HKCLKTKELRIRTCQVCCATSPCHQRSCGFLMRLPWGKRDYWDFLWRRLFLLWEWTIEGCAAAMTGTLQPVLNGYASHDGFTLYTATDGPRATLLDMRASMVHRWELPFRQAWSQAPHVKDPLPDGQIHWFRGHLYANGDLLAIY